MDYEKADKLFKKSEAFFHELVDILANEAHADLRDRVFDSLPRLAGSGKFEFTHHISKLAYATELMGSAMGQLDDLRCLFTEKGESS